VGVGDELSKFTIRLIFEITDIFNNLRVTLMKTFRLFCICSIFLSLYFTACKEQKEIVLSEKENTQDSIRIERNVEVSERTNPSDTTININCVKLTVRVIDEKGNNITPCSIEYTISGQPQTDVKWNLPIKGDTAITIRTTDITSYVIIKTKNYANIYYISTITKDAQIVFVIKDCKE
jgi:hypothetical protein